MNSEIGMWPPAHRDYAYPPACKPYRLYGLEAAPVGMRKCPQGQHPIVYNQFEF